MQITKLEVYQVYILLYDYSKNKLLELTGQLSIESHQTSPKCVLSINKQLIKMAGA